MIDSAAKNQGRYQFYFNFRVSFIPYIFNNFIIYKIISAGFVILTFISSFILIKRINLNLAYLFLLLLLVLYPSTLEHNLIMSYPVFLQIPWLCLMLALEFFLQSLENKNYTKLKLLISAFLLYIAILPYEQFIIYFVLFFLLSYFYKNLNYEYKQIIIKHNK